MKVINKLLVASQDPSVRSVLQKVLTPQHEIEFHPGGEVPGEAPEPDLTLVDADSKDGPRLLTQLRGRWPSVPMILLSSSTADLASATDSGCADFLKKPLDEGEVLAKVETALSLSSQHALLDERAKFDNVLEAMGDGIVLLDAELKITRMNQKARDYLQAPREAAPPAFLERLEELFEVRYAGDIETDLHDGPLVFDVERPETETQRPLILEVSLGPIRDAFRALTGVVAILTDVTDKRKRAFQEEMFLNFISHKLRTPMAIVHKNASLFHKKMLGPLNPDQEKFMGVLYEKSCELVDSFEKLLGFTMLKSKRLDLPPEKIVLSEYLRARLDAMSRLPRPKKLEWELDCDEEASVSLNKKYFDLVFNNLVENAAKFCDKETARVWIKAEALGDQVDFSVRDNGPGVPPEESEKIFEEFYQVDKDRTLNVAGTGLGLAIVRHIVNASGGEILLKSQPGEGATFYFTLPA
ncbi:MAG TPA: ATP-binding protein [Candidatus Eisenbacteria bacterium]|nr:ATP-binding protein [Candidatus Eisenbacteria bacterium]